MYIHLYMDVFEGGDSVTVPGQKPVSVFFTDDVLQWHTDRKTASQYALQPGRNFNW